MDKLRPRLKSIYEMYVDNTKKIEVEYEKYFKDGANKIYANELIIKKKVELEQQLYNVGINHERYMNEALNVRVSQLDPDANTINSIEYQTKLSNTLNLLSMSKGNVDTKLIDFIVEARDTSTMDILQEAYPQTEISHYLEKNNIKNTIEDMTEKVEVLKSVLNPQNKDTYRSRVAILSLYDDTVKMF